MPNIGVLLRDEIFRLSRRALGSEVRATKKASAQHRRHITALKRQVAQLEHQVSSLVRRVGQVVQAAPVDASPKRVRFAARGVRSQRERLGLSANDFGRLVGVSAQSVYNWEHASAKPRAEQLTTLAGLRQLGKRQAQARLQQLDASKAKPRRKRSRSR